MNDFETIDLIWIIGALVLVLAAVAAHRPSLRMVLGSLATWGAIGLIAWVAVANRHELGALFARATAQLGLDDQQVQGETVRIRMGPDGHFWARVKLNGVERRMLIDSGATITAISERTAEAAGIRPGAGFPVIIETANGSVTARRGRAGTVEIGPLGTQDLGVVIAPNFGDLDVLGMNFLSRLGSWRVESNVLVLEPDREAGSRGADVTAAEPDDSERAPRRGSRSYDSEGRSERIEFRVARARS